VAHPRPLADRSATVLVRLARLPRFVPVLAVVGLLLGGLVLPGAGGAALLLVLTALVGWLAWLTRPTHSPATTGLRLAVLALLLVAAVSKLW
jgi:hypothetical protein